MTADFAKETDQELEAFFKALGDEPEEVSPDLLERVLADAYDAQDLLAVEAFVEPQPEPAERSRGLLGSLLDTIGGWPAVAGLATATVAGVWIGYNPPAAFDTLTLTLMDSSYGASIGETLPDFIDQLADG